MMLLEEYSGGTQDIVVKVDEYLLKDCHRSKLPRSHQHLSLRRSGFGHLATWEGLHIGEQIERPLFIHPQFVSLPAPGVSGVRQRLEDKLDADGRPIVLLHASAGSANRVIPMNILNDAAAKLRDEAAVALLKPFPGAPEDPAFTLPQVGFELEELPDALYAVNAFVCPDTGPAHIAAAVRNHPVNQFDSDADEAWQSEVIWLAGSSNFQAVRYGVNLGVNPYSDCRMLGGGGCGWHGYSTPPPNVSGQPVFAHPGNPKVACLYESFVQTPYVAPCMATFRAVDIVKAVRIALTSGRTV